MLFSPCDLHPDKDKSTSNTINIGIIDIDKGLIERLFEVNDYESIVSPFSPK